MSNIGTLTVDMIKGIVLTARQTLTQWETPGLDGYGALLDGSRAPECGLVTITYTDNDADAVAHGAAANALETTIVSITDDWGDTYDNVLITKVDCTGFKQPCIYLGNASAVRCQIYFRVRSIN